MIRRYPARDILRDYRMATRRDGEPRFGKFGTIVYVFRLAMESTYQTNLKPQNHGKLYHPVDTPEEASYWLDYYRDQTTIIGFVPQPLYERAWFLPTGPNGNQKP